MSESVQSETLEEYAARITATWPTPTEHQRARLSALLNLPSTEPQGPTPTAKDEWDV